MRILIVLVAVYCLFSYSCSVQRELTGIWETTTLDEKSARQLDFFLNDFDLFDPPIYIPIIRITEDSLDYPLGFDLKNQHGLGGRAVSYSLDGSTLQILDGKINETFNVDFPTSHSFCLSKEGKKVLCFEKLNEFSNCVDYTINLKISNEYYVHNIFIDNKSEVMVSREGVKVDSIETALTLYEKNYLDFIISLIDFNQKGISTDQRISGDYTEYELLIACENGKILDETFKGRMGIPFGIRALLFNLDSYSKKEF